MPPVVVEEICTITAKGQTTVPKAVRQALGVGYGGHITFWMEGGAVTMRALAPEADREGTAEDPALTLFLALLEAGLAARPAVARAPAPGGPGGPAGGVGSRSEGGSGSGRFHRGRREPVAGARA